MQEKPKAPGVGWTVRGLFWIKSGDTYSRTFGTTIGSESLTTVFGMGTGVAFRIWSPERSGRPTVKGRDARTWLLVSES